MPVPTVDLNENASGSVYSTEANEESCILHGNEMLQLPSSPENLVLVQVNQGETFTIQNEDGTCRNIPGPALVPMISQNGAIPPIFVPPGYISQVFEENGIRRIVVLPNSTSNIMENGQSDLPNPPLHNPSYHYPMFHHPAIPHMQFPMNGYHPTFIPHQNVSMMPNYQQETMHFPPRPMYAGDGPMNCSACPPWYYASEFVPDYTQPYCQPVSLESQPPAPADLSQGDGAQRQGVDFAVCANHPPPAAQPQVKVVYCAFSPHGEGSRDCDTSAISESRKASQCRVEEPVKGRMTSSRSGLIQDETCFQDVVTISLDSSDSAYGSIRHSCVSVTPPPSSLHTSSSISFQSYHIEQHPGEQQSYVQSSSQSPPGTYSISSSPNSSSSCSSPPTSPKKARHSSHQNGHAPGCSSLDEDIYKCELADSKLDSYPHDLQCPHPPIDAGSSEDEKPSLRRRDGPLNGVHVSDSNCFSSIKQLLAVLKKPEVRDVRSRSALIVWSSLPVNYADPSLSLKLAKTSITFDLHLASRKKDAGKFAVVYSGTDHQHTVNDLRPATDYSLRLFAVCDHERSPSNGVTSFRTPASVPDAPALPTLQPKAKNFLILRWKAPHDNGEKITKYHVEVSEGQNSERLQSTQTSTPKQFVVQKLAPSRYYVFRLAAENKVGRSLWSPKLCYSTTRSVPPTPNPPRIVKVGEKSITLAWDSPSSEVTGYTLEMAADSSTYGFRPVYNGPDEKCTVKISPRNSHYQFRLLAYNTDEKSPHSETLSYFTEKPVVSALAPQPRVSGAVKSRSCEINWESPRSFPGSEVTRYVLEMTSDKTGAPKQVYSGPNRQCVVDNLEPVHTYRFRLIYFYNGGSSSPSDPLVVTTSPAIPGYCSTPTLALRPKPTSLTIKWDPPNDEGDAIATGYEANCIAICDICKKEPLQAYRGDATECTIENLTPGTKYSLAVRAVNNIGVGPWSENLEVVTGAAVPDKCETPIATVFGPTKVHLQWTSPAGNGANVLNYKLYWGSDETDLRPFLTAMHVHEFSNLNPNTTYHFNLQAINRVGSGPLSEIGSVQTNSGAPDSVSGLCVIGSGSDVDDDKSLVSASEVNLRWDEPRDNGSKILGYKIHLSPTPVDPTYGIIEVHDVIASLKDLCPDTCYSVKVCAFNAIGCGCFSSSKTIRTKPLPLPVPVLSCSAVSYSNMTLEWTDGSKVSEDRQFVLQMQDKNGRFSTLYQGNLRTKKVTKLVENTTYNFRVKAIGADGNSQVRLSKVHSFTTSLHLPTVEAPVVNHVTPTSCKVTWTHSSKAKKDLVGYQLHLEMDGKPEFRKVLHCKSNHHLLEDLPPNSSFRIFLCSVRYRSTNHSLSSRNNPRSSEQDLIGPPSPTVTFHTVDWDVKNVTTSTRSDVDVRKTTSNDVELTHSENRTGLSPGAGIEPEIKKRVRSMVSFFLLSVLCSYFLFLCAN